MKVTFEHDPESGEYYAVSDYAAYNEQIVDSLWWAELIPNDLGFIVIFDDDYRNKIQMSTLDEAKEYVLKHYSTHKPQIIGNRYPI